MEHEVSHTNPGFGKNTNGMGIAIVVLVAILLSLTAWWLWNGAQEEADHYRYKTVAAAHGGHDEHGEAHAALKAYVNPLELGTYDSVSGNFIYTIGNEIIITLPDSAKTELRVGANSTEAKLYKFLVEENMVVDTVDKTKGWITCDRIYFLTDKHDLTPESRTQISNIATILKAFPKAELKVGGYTDSTGSAAHNQELSASRAAEVLAMLQKDGAKNAAASEGYGSQWPISDNATPEGRALNRRTDIRVIKK
jgi:outer membrane protein OmpA-like peptidoglycan-associated protein